MNVFCRLGLHRWKRERVKGVPMRECHECHRCEFKPKGRSYWWEAGKGVTIAFQKQFYLVQERLGELRNSYQRGEITMEEWSKASDELHEGLSEFC